MADGDQISGLQPGVAPGAFANLRLIDGATANDSGVWRPAAGFSRGTIEVPAGVSFSGTIQIMGWNQPGPPSNNTDGEILGIIDNTGAEH